MRKVIIYEDANGNEIRREVVEADPVCGEDFCDACGDCLVCYETDCCVDDGGHVWIEYQEDTHE